jgi:hypothetical protein
MLRYTEQAGSASVKPAPARFGLARGSHASPHSFRDTVLAWYAALDLALALCCAVRTAPVPRFSMYLFDIDQHPIPA